MMKLTVMYTPPSDPEAFDAHYTSVHIPMVQKMPGLERLETSRSVPGPDGAPAPLHRTADLYFASPDAMGEAFGSEIGQETGKDAAELCARTGTTMSTVVFVVD